MDSVQSSSFVSSAPTISGERKNVHSVITVFLIVAIQPIGGVAANLFLFIVDSFLFIFLFIQKMLPIRILLAICPKGGFLQQRKFFFHAQQAGRLKGNCADLFGDFFCNSFF